MNFPIGVMKIKDRSMEPKLYEGDYVIINKWKRRYKVGDIVILRSPRDGMTVVKRVVRVNDSGLIYVFGDNMTLSQDSRHFGPVGVGNIMGKVIKVL